MTMPKLWPKAIPLVLCIMSIAASSDFSLNMTSKIVKANDEGYSTVPPPGYVGSFVLSLPYIAQIAHLYLPLIQDSRIYQPYPASGATDQSLNAYLSWKLNDNLLTDPRYEIYIASDDAVPNNLLASGIVQSSFDPSTFELDTQYFWRVVAIGSNGHRVEGPVWTFRTEPFLDPPEIGKMVTVPEGEFQMGCDRYVEPCRADDTHAEEPLHKVYLDAFDIDKYEVTNQEYAACVLSGSCKPPRRFNSATHDQYYNNPQYDLFPVLYVSWEDATNYCAWVGKRLPTEAEWEKAARGPIDTRRWPWGSEREDCSRVSVVRGKTCPPLDRPDMTQVGTHPRNASPYGAMDMAGNAFEWVNDKYDVLYYQISPYHNPPGPIASKPTRIPRQETTTYYTIRGGSNVDNWYYMRVVHRHFGHWGDEPMTDAPYFRSYRVGYRCARSLSQ